MTIPSFVGGTVLTASELNQALDDTAAQAVTNVQAQENTWQKPQTLQAAVLQSLAAGSENESPFLNAGDAFSDFIANGMQWQIPSSASLTTSMSGGTNGGPGVAYLGDVRTLIAPIDSQTFPASNDTYVSFNNSGQAAFQSVANGAAAPTPAAGYVQTAKVVTSPIVSPVPTLTAGSSGGTLAAGTYLGALVAHDATGYGAVSATGSVTVALDGTMIFNWANPLNETSMDIYATTAGSTTLGLVASGVTGTSYTYTGSVAPGAAAPTTATSNAVQLASRLLGLFPYKEGQGIVTPEMFGATGLGFPYDDSGPINNALNYVSSVGGGVVYCTKTYYCNDNITVPDNCSLRGIYGPKPSPSGSNNSNYSSELVFNGDYGVIQGFSSHVGGLIIFSLIAKQAPNNVAPFFSNGYGVYGSGAIDASCVDCGIFGFNTAVNYVNNCGRAVVKDIYFDCQNGVIINGAFDTCNVVRCHGWPQLETAGKILREGIGIGIIGGNSSWHRVIDCEAVCWETAFLNQDSGNNLFINCGADSSFVGAAGPGTAFSMTGNYYGTTVLRGFQCTSTTAINVNVTGSSQSEPALTVDGIQVWGPNGTGMFEIESGYVNVNGLVLPQGRTDFGTVVNPAGNLSISGPSANLIASSANNLPNVNIYSDQAIQFLIYTESLTFSPIARESILSGLNGTTDITITLNPGAFRGQKVRVYSNGDTGIPTIASSVSTGSPYFHSTDGSVAYSLSLPASNTALFIDFEWEQNNWRYTTSGNIWQSFIPNLTFSGGGATFTYTTQDGSYQIKDGLLHLEIQTVCSYTGAASGVLEINNLPLGSLSTSNPNGAIVSPYNLGFTNLTGPIACGAQGTTLYFFEPGAGGQYDNVTAANTASGTTITMNISGYYRI